MPYYRQGKAFERRLILSKYNITVSEKRNEINQIKNNTDSFTKFSAAYSGSKDNTQYVYSVPPVWGVNRNTKATSYSQRTEEKKTFQQLLDEAMKENLEIPEE